MKIRIPAQTVEVDADRWALEYGIEKSEVRKDVVELLSYLAHGHIDSLGLGIKED